MPSIIGHLALPLALQLGLGRRQIPLSAGVVGCALAMAPDLDVIGWHLGINYGAITGHRGFSHSLLVAVGCGLLLAPLWRQSSLSSWPIFDAVYGFTRPTRCLYHGRQRRRLTLAMERTTLVWPMASDPRIAIKPQDIFQ